MSGNGDDTKWIMVSFLTMRRVVGVLGMALPIVVVCGTWLFAWRLEVRSSISAYFNSPMGPAFAGILFVVGWFLFAYKGHDDRDDKAGDRACLFAMGVAMFPHVSENHAWVPWVHFISAGLLFLTLAYYSYFLFTLSKEDDPGEMKRFRNKIYRTCGVLIVVFIALLLVYNIANWVTGETLLAGLRPVLVLETLMLWAFGFSWFVKGETLWADEKAEA